MEALLTEPSAQTKRGIALKNILFPTDFSDASKIALPWAVALARHYGATLHLAHVTRSTVCPVGIGGDLAGAFDTSIFAERLMQELRDHLGEVCPTQTHLADGLIEDILPELVEKTAADWIVLGTHGRSGVSKFLLGSSTEEILRIATRPVLTLGPHLLSSAAHAGKLDLHCGEIQCIVDFAAAYERAIESALALAEEYQSRLTLLHVIWSHGRIQPAEQAVLRANMEQLLRQAVPSVAGLSGQPEFVVEIEHRPSKAPDTVLYRAADLVVQTMGFGGARHTALHVIRLAPCPVLTIPFGSKGE
jgi:nucleotide-binding universal stress UspA family protein